MTDKTKKTCTNFTPAGFWSHWKEWHRGHGCDLDDGKEPPAGWLFHQGQAPMKVLDPGHLYELANLDAPPRSVGVLRFVKRIGAKYPGNEPPGYAGTTSQEVLRALIDRARYVNGQASFWQNEAAITSLRDALYHLEHRAAVVRGDIEEFSRVMNSGPDLLIEDMSTCDRCGHIACTRTAEQHD